MIIDKIVVVKNSLFIANTRMPANTNTVRLSRKTPVFVGVGLLNVRDATTTPTNNKNARPFIKFLNFLMPNFSFIIISSYFSFKSNI